MARGIVAALALLQPGMAVLFVTHHVDEAILLTDRVMVMSACGSRIQAELPVLLTQPRLPSLNVRSITCSASEKSAIAGIIPLVARGLEPCEPFASHARLG